MSYETVSVSGPIFDGRAQAASDEWTRASEEDLAKQIQQSIRSRARTFDRSGRGGTGRAAAAVSVRGSYVVTGNSNKGVVWWPWLEGTSKRNQSTRFKGYHTFRTMAAEGQRRAGRVAQAKLPPYLRAMND